MSVASQGRIQQIEELMADNGIKAKECCPFWEWLGNERFRAERDAEQDATGEANLTDEVADRIMRDMPALIREWRDR